jgi:hypothetical protein
VSQEIGVQKGWLLYNYINKYSMPTSFNDYSYYLKGIRWILNNSLAETTIRSSSSITRSSLLVDIEEEKHILKEGMKTSAAPIPDLEKWSEYKVRRLVEERRMD